MIKAWRVLYVGFLQWVAVGLAAIATYMVELNAITEWDWFAVGTGAVAHVSAGLAALGRFLQVSARALIIDAPEATRLDPDYMQIGHIPDDPLIEPEKPDLFVPAQVYSPELIDGSRHFKRSELECRGMNCGCTYPGMSKFTLSVADELRDVFGPLLVTSAYRCPVHNASIPDSSDKSWHMKSAAIDLKPVQEEGRRKVTPKQLYDWLNARFPEQYGIGLYNTFVHWDDRPSPYFARKTSPDSGWHQQLIPDLTLAE